MASNPQRRADVERDDAARSLDVGKGRAPAIQVGLGRTITLQPRVGMVENRHASGSSSKSRSWRLPLESRGRVDIAHGIRVTEPVDRLYGRDDLRLI